MSTGKSARQRAPGRARLGPPRWNITWRSRLLVQSIGGLAALNLMLVTACGVGSVKGSSAQPHSSSSEVSPDGAAVLHLASYAGRWYVHGATLTVGSNGSGNMTWNAGPCSQDINVDEGMCTGHASIAFKPVAGGLTSILTKVWYTASSGPLPHDFTQPTQPAAKESFALKRVSADVLYTTWYSNPAMNEGNRNWCRLSYSNSQVCGA